MEYLKIAPSSAARLTPSRWSAGQDPAWRSSRASTTRRAPRPTSAWSPRAPRRCCRRSPRAWSLAPSTACSACTRRRSPASRSPIQSAEELVDRGIGWVTESAATTEGSAIYLPPFVATFEEQVANFQVYKVYTTHQAARMEFGSFRYRWARDGVFTGPPAVADARPCCSARAPHVLPRSRRSVRHRGDHARSSGSSTLRRPPADRRVVHHRGGHAHRQPTSRASTAASAAGCAVAGVRGGPPPQVEEMGLRAGVRGEPAARLARSAGHDRWPVAYREEMRRASAALKVVEQPGATVQDSAEVAAALYDIAMAIPNIKATLGRQVEFEPPTTRRCSSSPACRPVTATRRDACRTMEEMQFENPPQPEFRGDFKPELVQLLAKLKNQQEGDQDGANAPLTKEQLMELLENSVEISINEWAEGDLARASACSWRTWSSRPDGARATRSRRTARRASPDRAPGGGGEVTRANCRSRSTTSLRRVGLPRR
jgi:hypothetical protein